MLNDSLKLSKNVFNANIKKDSTRNGFGEGLLTLGEKNKNVVVLTADLMESTRTHNFAEKYPKRFVQVGVAEQNMAGISAGLALSGKIPFMTSFATFSPGRNWEQIKVSICYTGANVKIASTHAGLSASGDGATHQGLEDVALTRVLPGMTVLCPADYNQAQKVVEAAAEIKGSVYLRFFRNKSPIFTTKNTPFSVGKAQIMKKGDDITLITCGPILYETLKAARELQLKHDIEAEVLNVHTIKPLDEEAIVRSALKTKIVLTVEEHQITGGLGGAVSELLSEKAPVLIHKAGVKDTWGESGTYQDLIDKHKLTHAYLVEKVKSLTLSARGKK